MAQLPINPIIRARLDKAPLIDAVEHNIRMTYWFEKPRNRMLFLRDGLIDTQCFPAFYGAFFILNLERHLAGDLDEDQLDNFVSILLDNAQIPYLKAVHPKADIEGHFTALLRERRNNSRSSYLQGRLDQYGRLPSWRRVRKGDPRYPIHDLVMRDGPFSIALGHKPAVVLEQLQQELWKAVLALDVHPSREQPLFDRYLDNFLIGYPELWPVVGADASRFLGSPMLKQFAHEGFSADKSVINGHSGNPLVGKGGERREQELSGFVLDYLSAIDPDVLDAKHLLLDGSRSHAWLDRCPNLEDGLDLLSQLCHYGVPHPALKRIKQVATRLPEEGQKGLVQQYLDHGSAVTERLTQAIFQAQPELYDWALEQCHGYTAVKRLAKIKRLSGEQIGRLEPEVKRRLLEGDLGV
ncbi:hypothetical protein F3I62_18905 [Pseudomonas sp. R-28-1W-6]|uniref:hypothetical protein n=1 Tax=Pseudomonas sp. R-28-1W-6 TaxID=2650101 RepID=UPI0013657978|nr:hypothetical protein [Pseudomonas sp. R-28-1W-6]MWV14175.1 hypothetical protein [Pseudomonas sp. R-28-1W-6]